jgi:hypothetical protein
MAVNAEAAAVVAEAMEDAAEVPAVFPAVTS